MKIPAFAQQQIDSADSTLGAPRWLSATAIFCAVIVMAAVFIVGTLAWPFWLVRGVQQRRIVRERERQDRQAAQIDLLYGRNAEGLSHE